MYKTLSLTVLSVLLLSVEKLPQAHAHLMLPSSQLTFEPTRVVHNFTENILLSCDVSPPDPASNLTEMATVTGITIWKKGDNNHWRIVVEYYDDRFSSSYDFPRSQGMKSLGDLRNVQVRWSMADDNTFGLYRCDVVGEHIYRRTAVQVSHEVEIKPSALTVAEVKSLIEKAAQQPKSQCN